MSEARKPGVQVRREVMGDAFVDRALGNATEFTQPLQDFVNEHAWGGVWNREGLDRRTRSLITLAALTALKCPRSSGPRARRAEQRLHRGRDPRSAALRRLCRRPAAIDAFRAAQEVIDAWQADQKA